MKAAKPVRPGVRAVIALTLSATALFASPQSNAQGGLVEGALLRY